MSVPLVRLLRVAAGQPALPAVAAVARVSYSLMYVWGHAAAGMSGYMALYLRQDELQRVMCNVQSVMCNV